MEVYWKDSGETPPVLINLENEKVWLSNDDQILNIKIDTYQSQQPTVETVDKYLICESEDNSYKYVGPNTRLPAKEGK